MIHLFKSDADEVCPFNQSKQRSAQAKNETPAT